MVFRLLYLVNAVAAPGVIHGDGFKVSAKGTDKIKHFF
jgi:hypothetical protein